MKPVIFLLMFISMHSFANFKEGKHYITIETAVISKKPKVTEYFSYLCPHCYNFEKKYIPDLKKALNTRQIEFQQSHAELSNDQVSRAMSRAHAISYYLNIEKDIKIKLFEAVQKDRKQFTEEGALKKFFVAQGISEKDFDAQAKGFMVNNMIEQMRQSAQEAKIRGVPAFVVNNKYLIQSNSVKTYDELTKLILFVADKYSVKSKKKT